MVCPVGSAAEITLSRTSVLGYPSVSIVIPPILSFAFVLTPVATSPILSFAMPMVLTFYTIALPVPVGDGEGAGGYFVLSLVLGRWVGNWFSYRSSGLRLLSLCEGRLDYFLWEGYVLVNIAS